VLASPPNIDLLPGLLCMYYPRKKTYATADEASVALRQIAVTYMERGIFDERLVVFDCCDHWHTGRPRVRESPRTA
jgi:hypothetical protein